MSALFNVVALNRAFTNSNLSGDALDAAVVSYIANANAYAQSLIPSGMGNATLANLVLTNMGVLPTSDAAVAAFEGALTDYFGSVPSALRGAVVEQVANLLSNVEFASNATPGWVAVAHNWNVELADALAVDTISAANAATATVEGLLAAATASLESANATIATLTEELATTSALLDAANASLTAAEAAAAEAAAAAAAAATAAAAELAAAEAAAAAAATAAAAELAAAEAAAAAAATAAAAELATSEGLLAAANATITAINNTDYDTEQAAYDAGVTSRDAEVQTLEDQIFALENPDPLDNLALTTSANTVIGTGAGDVVSGTQTTLNSTDIIIDAVSGDGDTLNVTATDDLVAANAATVVGFENVNYTVQAFVTAAGTNTVFDIDNSGVAASSINIDVDQAGSSIVSTTITGVATGSTVTTSADFTTTVIVSGDDNAAITVNSAAASIQATSGSGALTGATITGTQSGTGAVTRFDTNSDAATVLTTTSSDLEIDAVAATSVTATSSGSIVADNSADNTTENLTAATTVNLTAADEIIAEMTAATSATLSAGFGDATTVTVSTLTGASLTTLNLSGNGSAPTFNTEAATAVRTINISGSQNVTVQMGLDDVAGLTTAPTLTDSSTGTSTVKFVSGTGSANLTGVLADVINVGVTQNGSVLTFASGAAVTLSANQTAITVDGTDAGAATNSVALTTNNGSATDSTAVTLTAVTFTDFNSATIDVSTDDASSTIGTITATADDTDVTINAGSRGLTLSTAVSLDTGDLVINSTGAIAGGSTAITANSLTASGSGAVTLTAINSSNLATVTTGSGSDALTISATGGSLTLNAGDGTNTVTLGANTTANKTYAISAGSGFDTFAIADGVTATAGTLTLSGFERISFNQTGGNGNAATVANSLLDGKSYILTNDETVGATAITVTLGTGEVSSNLSGLVLDANWSSTNDSITITDSTNANITLTGANGLGNSFTTGSGNDTLTGGNAADTLIAGNGTNTITGGAGADTLTGGTGVDTIDGGADGDTITAGTGNDIITAGAGTDIVYGGGGADTIDLTETTSAADNVLIVATSDGSAAGAAAGTFTGYDVITGFTAGTDDIVFDSNTNGDDTVDTAIVAGSVEVHAATAATTASNDLTLSNYTDVDQVVNYINDLIVNAVYTPDNTNADLFAVTFGSGTSGTTVLYYVVDDSAAVDATEISLIAVVNGVLTAADLIIA